jgi:hypothetical protein
VSVVAVTVVAADDDADAADDVAVAGVGLGGERMEITVGEEEKGDFGVVAVLPDTLTDDEMSIGGGALRLNEEVDDDEDEDESVDAEEIEGTALTEVAEAEVVVAFVVVEAVVAWVMAPL